ncbi:MAG TPA: hypothetical protein VJL29_11005 [Thermoguttaceae bacterium]|nr:hypothetical protein [Thermoguttaceae bacterium]
MHKLAYLPILFIVLGAALLLAAFAWSRMKDPRDFWPEEKAETLSAAGLEYHGAAHRMTHVESDTQKEELQRQFDQARDRYTQQQTAFAEAQDRYERPYRILWWSGIACLALGVLGHFLVRSSAAR